MKIGLIGYGKMGKTIEALAVQAGHEVVEKYNSQNPFLEANQCNADVLIEFTLPKFAVSHIEKALELNVPIVVGTTGWNDQEASVKKQVEESNGSLFYASNFSIGVHLFFEINKQLSAWMKREDYRLGVHEIHHTEKLDAPSGTALTLLNKIQETNAGAACEITHDRIENVPGTHIVRWENEIDEITLEHKAKNRNGFAMGSIRAAEFLHNKKGVFGMEDLLKLNK